MSFKNRRIITVVSADPQPSTNIWVCPGGVLRVRLVGFGGGGGGGGGAGGTDTLNCYSGGGGGGGGAVQSEIEIDVTPGVIYEAVIGAGGSGGAGGAKYGHGTAGSAGGNTIFRVQDGSTLYTFRGADGGMYGDLNTSNTQILFSEGGSPVPGRRRADRAYRFASTGEFWISNGRPFPFDNIPGSGGPGTTTHGDTSTLSANQNPGSVRNGSASIQGFSGGAGGIMGYDNGSSYVKGDRGAGFYQEGGPGGGGGGGPAGPGGHGGSMYDQYMDAGGYTSAFAPSAAGANTGAGGGGGSGGFAASDIGDATNGINGQAGGSGRLIIYW